MENPPFSIGNTSSFLVDFPASYVRLPEGTSKSLRCFLSIPSYNCLDTKACVHFYPSNTHMCVSKTSWTRWWFQQPTHFKNITVVNLDHETPRIRGENGQTCLSCHHRSVMGDLLSTPAASSHLGGPLCSPGCFFFLAF